MSAARQLLAWAIALSLLALPVVGVLQGWLGDERWPIRVLALQAPFKLVDEASVRDTVAPMAERGFFATDPAAIREAVAALPWVDRVDVRKRWPDRIEVRLSELRPYAHWSGNRLLSDDGRLFAAPTAATARLPRFDGADDRAPDLIAFHRDARPLLIRAGDDVRELRLSARGGWSLVTDSGLSIELGRSDPLARLGRFVRLLPTLRQDPAGRALLSADLRYTNGFALTWGEPALPSSPA